MTPMRALQETLAAEHAAVYVYALLGGRLSASEHPGPAILLRDAYDAHLERRDRLRGVIAGLGDTPEPAAPAYRVDAEDRSPASLLRIGRLTEERCAAVYAQLVAASTGSRRRWAIEALSDSAVRALGLGAPAAAYPGLPEL
ncbi:MAG: hypothetical protein AVDCRST_MAG34-441 [uncultured Nocardioidaceae bacterium]|uniref:DUF4439 domain-containing protein n=1 Tax=uncultured Nocardioidaceae bacterium TaxID=253824 RepID=A0A6J4LG27_9ACTN|nr:MAG: hypothetical protein AVDCRST_MAG34-441 [uncultured Nocardioidaceae bacterium]